MNNIVLLGSKSPSRALLLTQAGIPFNIIEQLADESQCPVNFSFAKRVSTIAEYKMNHVVLNHGNTEGEHCFVLTADTMIQDCNGIIHGKPIDKDDAISKIKNARNGCTAATAFCLDKKIWKNHSWHTINRIAEVLQAEYIFDIPDAWIESYLQNTLAMQCAGAGAVEGFGSQFLRSVNGSYSAIIGLPLYEVHCALEKLNFFE